MREKDPANVFTHRFPQWKKEIFPNDEEERKMFNVNILPTYTIEISSDESEVEDEKASVKLYQPLVNTNDLIVISDSE